MFGCKFCVLNSRSRAGCPITTNPHSSTYNYVVTGALPLGLNWHTPSAVARTNGKFQTCTRGGAGDVFKSTFSQAVPVHSVWERKRRRAGARVQNEAGTALRNSEKNQIVEHARAHTPKGRADSSGLQTYFRSLLAKVVQAGLPA